MDEALERIRRARIAINQDQPTDELSGVAKREFIERFIHEKRLLNYPAPTEELKDENVGLPLKSDDRWQLTEQHIARALELHGVSDVDARASQLTFVLLNSVDPGLLCTVESLPYKDVAVDRILAHVEALQIGVSPGLASSIARRVTLVLLNNRGR